MNLLKEYSFSQYWIVDFPSAIFHYYTDSVKLLCYFEYQYLEP